MAKRTRGGLSDRITDLVLRGLIGLALRLPWTMRVRLMGWLVRAIIAPLAGWRARALANLAHVWPDMPQGRRRRIAAAAAGNAGRTMIENYDVEGLRARVRGVTIEGAGLAVAEAARAERRPVLFVTGHYGNHEAPRAALVERGFQVGGLYRPMANPFFNAHYAANMHALSGPVFEQGARGTLGLLRHLRGGGMGVLLFDIYAGAGEPIEFLGQPAPTLTSAADIALKTGAVLIPFFGIRQADGLSFRILFEAPIPHGDPVEMTREMTRRLETRIAEDPGQWFWLHRRWKPQRQARRQRRRAAASTGP